MESLQLAVIIKVDTNTEPMTSLWLR